MRVKNIKTAILACLVVILIPSVANAQGVTIGSSNPPDPSAALDVQSTSGGFALPRLTTVQRNAIANPVIGLMIYNMDSECYEGYFASGWKSIACNCQSFPSASFTVSNLNPGTNQPVNVSPSNPVPGESYQWSFPGGTPASSGQQNAASQWSSQGAYWIVLTVTDQQGCSAIDSQQVTVTPCSGGQNQQQVFSYTGGPQTFTVPAGICSLYVECWGAQGWDGSNNGGRGGYASGNLAVMPGQQLYIYVGGQGTVAIGNMNPQGGGWNGGGNGQNNGTSNTVGGGGGASDVRTVLDNNPLNLTSLQSRIIVAGGGGGSTNNSGCTGGHGGGTNGNAGAQTSWIPGQGGTQSSGGTTGGAFGEGGSGGPGMTPWNGGGGGGWYGGGTSTAHAGGGGGSGYTGGVTNASMQTGVKIGNGQVIIHW